MFDFIKHINSGTSFHRIVANRLVLDQDEERDITMLYSGTNHLGVRLVGSRITTERDESCWYFHTTVAEKDYVKFLNREVTLLSLMEVSDYIYVVQFSADGYELRHSLIPFNNIPPDYRPRSRSLCPKHSHAASFVYTSSLKGGKADVYMASPESVRSMTNGIATMLMASTDFMEKHLKVRRDVFLEGGHAIAASYRLDFRIEFDTSNKLFLEHQQEIAQYLKNLMNYILVETSKEGIPDENTYSDSIVKLAEELRSIYKHTSDVYPMILPDDSNHREVIRAVEGSLLGIKSIGTSSDYEYIEFGNKTEGDVPIPMAIIDTTFMNDVASRVGSDELEEIERTIRIDADPTPDTIEVESFASRSGKGAGVVHLGPSMKAPVRIIATGRKSYDHTPFSQSLHLKRSVTIMGKATRENDVIRSIAFDSSTWDA